jgi:hypothetical protein
MKYLHVSTFIGDGNVIYPGKTYDVGKNRLKRMMRKGKARKDWPVIEKRVKENG